MRLLKRALLVVAVLSIVGYVAAVAWLAANETRLVFAGGEPLGRSRPAAPFEQIDVPRSDGARQIAFRMPHPDRADSRPWLLYLHGNAATIGARQNVSRCERLRALGLNVLAVEYRGYGGLDGTPSESSVTEDGRAGYEYLRGRGVPPERIVLYGWSLGSAVAVNLASTVATAAVILEGAPASLAAIGKREYPFMPIDLVMRNRFESVERIGRVRSPVLFIHSPSDDIVPIEEGRRLFAAANEPKQFIEVAGGHIYTSDTDGARMYAAIQEFLRRSRLTAD